MSIFKKPKTGSQNASAGLQFPKAPEAAESSKTETSKTEEHAESVARCPSCHGQLRMILALHLKNDRGEPLRYRACPADCNKLTRKDVAAGPRE